mgnify:CR=1 FL=1
MGERQKLLPLPAVPYEYMERRTAKVSADFHVRFDNAYYSVDKAYLHKSVMIAASATTVNIYFMKGKGDPSNVYSAKDMLHLPKRLRAKSSNYRFSIPGNPSLYLANSSYGCWIETGFPSENDFNVAPVLLDGTQKIFNLAVSMRDFHVLNDLEENRVHSYTVNH